MNIIWWIGTLIWDISIILHMVIFLKNTKESEFDKRMWITGAGMIVGNIIQAISHFVR